MSFFGKIQDWILSFFLNKLIHDHSDYGASKELKDFCPRWLFCYFLPHIFCSMFTTACHTFQIRNFLKLSAVFQTPQWYRTFRCCFHVSRFQSDFAQNVKSCFWMAYNSFKVTSQNIRFCIKKPVPILCNWSAWWLLINYHWINCKRKLNVLWLPVIYKQVRILYLVWVPPLMILV